MDKKTMMVARREFLENVRTKTFWIGILMFPVIWAVLLTVPSLLQKTKGVRKYAIVDNSAQQWFTAEFEQRTRLPDIVKLLEAYDDEAQRDGLPPNLGSGLFVFVRGLPEERRADAVVALSRLSEVDPKLLERAPDVGSEAWSKDKAKLLALIDRDGQGNGQEIEASLGAIEKLLPTSAAQGLPDKAALRALLQWMRPAIAKADDFKSLITEVRGAVHTELGAIKAWWWSKASSKSEDERSLALKFKASKEVGRFERVETTTEEDLRARVDKGKLFALFVVPEDPVGARPQQGGDATAAPRFTYVTTQEHLADRELREWFQNQATGIVRDRRVAKLGVQASDADWLAADIRFDDKQMKEGKEAEVSKGDVVGQFAPIVFVYLLWISVFTIANLLLTNTIEEKSNRLIEVLLSSVSPLQLMMGKIFGLAGTGLTMVASWAFFAVLGIKIAPLFGENFAATIGNWGLEQILLNPRYLLSFLIYFVFGYLLYAALLVGIGSVCNSLKEAQNLMQPVILLLIVPLLAMVPIAQEPNGTLAKVMSYIPPFTPFVMMNRAGGPPTLMEYGATTVLLLVTVGLAIVFAAKIFRIGILMTGKPPKVREIFGWLKAPVGSVYVRDEEQR